MASSQTREPTRSDETVKAEPIQLYQHTVESLDGIRTIPAAPIPGQEHLFENKDATPAAVEASVVGATTARRDTNESETDTLEDDSTEVLWEEQRREAGLQSDMVKLGTNDASSSCGPGFLTRGSAREPEKSPARK
jgi:hypothetical protein